MRRILVAISSMIVLNRISQKRETTNLKLGIEALKNIEGQV